MLIHTYTHIYIYTHTCIYSCTHTYIYLYIHIEQELVLAMNAAEDIKALKAKLLMMVDRIRSGKFVFMHIYMCTFYTYAHSFIHAFIHTCIQFFIHAYRERIA